MRKILIVDDEPHITKALNRELASWCSEHNLGIETENSPEEAMILLKNDNSIFLLLSDMMMPGINGVELASWAKDLNPELIVFIMTGYSHIELVVNAVNVGIHSLILKPWNITSIIGQLERAYENHILRENDLVLKKQIEEELKWGGELQKQLLLRHLPSNEKIRFSVHYEPLPALHCGGDYFDVIPLENDKYFVISADVSGHGIKAAFITTILKTIIYSGYISKHRDSLSPARFLSWLNRKLLTQLSNCPGILITAAALVIDADAKEISYSDAGHTPLFIFHNGNIQTLSLQGTALNFIESVDYEEKKFSLAAGDRIYILTDGLIEIGDNYKALKQEQIDRILINASSKMSDSRNLCGEIKKLASDNMFRDDITSIIMDL